MKPLTRPVDDKPAVLFGFKLNESKQNKEWHLRQELKTLCLTLGLVVVGEVEQVKRNHHRQLRLTAAKKDELVKVCQSNGAGIVVYESELSIAQHSAFEEETGLTLLHRTAIILEIFAKNAVSRQAKLQVELAKLQYLLPRLKGEGVVLSRLGGGIGTRGPGEKKLEHDRRVVRQKIHQLKKEIERIHQANTDRIERGKRDKIATIALVGYTNSGKTTLFNALTGATSLAENLLFATVDTLHRRMYLPNQQMLIIVDTVGLINNLPHQLIDSFKATLEEARMAEIVIIVVDASSDFWLEQLNTVKKVVYELGISEDRCIYAYNKIDNVSLMPFSSGAAAHDFFISAKEGTNISLLKKRIYEMFDCH